MGKRYTEAEKIQIVNTINNSGNKDRKMRELGIARASYWTWNKKYKNIENSKFVELETPVVNNKAKEICIEINNVKIKIVDDIELLKRIVSGLKTC